MCNIYEQGFEYYILNYLDWIVLSLSNLTIEIVNMYYWDIKLEILLVVVSVWLLDKIYGLVLAKRFLEE